MAERGGFEKIAGKATSVHLSYWQANGLGDGGKVERDQGRATSWCRRCWRWSTRWSTHFAKPGTPYPALPWPAYIPHFNDYAHLERVAEWSTRGGDDE